jgi:integrase
VQGFFLHLPQSINNYRAIIRAFFEYALKRELVDKKPVTSVDKVKLIGKAPEIFTPKQLADLLAAAAHIHCSDILWQYLVRLCCVPPALRFVQRYLHRKWLLKPPYISHNMHKFS